MNSQQKRKVILNLQPVLDLQSVIVLTMFLLYQFSILSILQIMQTSDISFT